MKRVTFLWLAATTGSIFVSFGFSSNEAGAVTRFCLGNPSVSGETLVGTRWRRVDRGLPHLVRSSRSRALSRRARNAACDAAAAGAVRVAQDRYTLRQLARLLCESAKATYRNQAANVGTRVRNIKVNGYAGAGFRSNATIQVRDMSCPPSMAMPAPDPIKVILCIDYADQSRRLQADFAVVGIRESHSVAAHYGWCLRTAYQGMQSAHRQRVNRLHARIRQLDRSVRSAAGNGKDALCAEYARVSFILQDLKRRRRPSGTPIVAKYEFERWCLRNTQSEVLNRKWNDYRRSGQGHNWRVRIALESYVKPIGYTGDPTSCMANKDKRGCHIVSRYWNCPRNQRLLNGRGCLGRIR